MNPLFGFNLEDQLFEQMGEARKSVILSGIRQALSTYFPRIVVQELTVEPLPEQEHSLQIYLRYGIKDSGESDEFVLNIEQ